MTTCLCIPPAHVEANAERPTTLDKQLLSADAIFFATIASVVSIAGGDRVVELELANARRVSSRWQQLPTTLRVRGDKGATADGRDLVRPAFVYEDLIEGDRYLFLLRGGNWRHTPLNPIGKGVFPVRDGEVKCHGGEVYGLTARGFLCSRRNVQAGAPLDEPTLAARLDAAVDDARRRRPALAERYESRARPFILEAGAGR